MFKRSLVLAAVVTVSGCSSLSINGNERYKNELCENVGTLYYQIAEAKRRGMSPVQLWRAIDLGIVDTMESDGISDSEVAALRKWGRSAITNVYHSDDTFGASDWKIAAIDQCQSQVEVHY